MERVLKHPCFKPNGWTPSVVIYWFRANLVFPPRFVSRSDIACSDTRDLASVKGYKRACLIVCRLPFGQRFLPSQCGLRNTIHEQYPYHGRFRAWCFPQKGYPKRVRAVLPVKLESVVAVYAGGAGSTVSTDGRWVKRGSRVLSISAPLSIPTQRLKPILECWTRPQEIWNLGLAQSRISTYTLPQTFTNRGRGLPCGCSKLE